MDPRPLLEPEGGGLVAGFALGLMGVLLLEGVLPFAGVLCVWILTCFPFVSLF